jgi:lipopolysaccharide/colanic/teichoic acid biosynthesis glycosyltransferase
MSEANALSGAGLALPAAIGTSRGGYEALKRCVDVAGSSALLAAGLPVLAAVAAAVKMTSAGPVVFKQTRLGRGGREFVCYKFRTMARDAEAVLASSKELAGRFERDFKIKDDPRVTRVGAFLRKTSLDELPQLVNVLRGEMSLIGPRPIVPRELAKYGAYGSVLLQVKPGLGGLWQVGGRSETSYPDRVAKDVEYVRRRSTWLDVKLIALTAAVVIKGRGAY